MSDYYEDREKAQKEQEAKNKIIREQIINWIPSEIARQPKVLQEYIDEWHVLQEGHFIRFTRFGDFVSVHQKVDGVKTTKAIQLIREYNKGEKGENTTLKPASITLLPGKEPNLEYSGYGYQDWDGKEYSFRSEVSRPVLGHISFRATEYYGGYYSNTVKVLIQTGLAWKQIPDRISFDGSGVIIEVPFGLGEDTYKQLMEALRES